MVTKTDYPRKLNFAEYEYSCSYNLLIDFNESRNDGSNMKTKHSLIYC